MSIKPLGDKVVLKATEEEEKSPGGIILPDTAKKKPQEGEVIAVGEGRHLENGKIRPLEVKKGDRIFFRKYAGNEVTIDGVEHVILREEEVLGVYQS
ncbi:MAG TPA: co-chaperone GroES [Thermoleophilia bacterium]|nr:co-chaperone GroES [Thermoleophilia bacterium]